MRLNTTFLLLRTIYAAVALWSSCGIAVASENTATALQSPQQQPGQNEKHLKVKRKASVTVLKQNGFIQAADILPLAPPSVRVGSANYIGASSPGASAFKPSHQALMNSSSDAVKTELKSLVPKVAVYRIVGIHWQDQ